MQGKNFREGDRSLENREPGLGTDCRPKSREPPKELSGSPQLRDRLKVKSQGRRCRKDEAERRKEIQESRRSRRPWKITFQGERVLLCYVLLHLPIAHSLTHNMALVLHDLTPHQAPQHLASLCISLGAFSFQPQNPLRHVTADTGCITSWVAPRTARRMRGARSVENITSRNEQQSCHWTMGCHCPYPSPAANARNSARVVAATAVSQAPRPRVQ